MYVTQNERMERGKNKDTGRFQLQLKIILHFYKGKTRENCINKSRDEYIALDKYNLSKFINTNRRYSHIFFVCYKHLMSSKMTILFYSPPK